MSAKRVIPIAAAGADAPLVSLYAKHSTIHPRTVRGWFQGWRWALVWVTQILFYGLPWITMHGRQAVLFDLVARRFYLFGLVLYPQDFIYLTGLLVASALSLFLFTAVGGRLWCGYACPQTVYSEIFMWIERRIEGDRVKRQKLDAATLDTRKFALKAAKHAAWGGVAIWTGFTFVGFFTPVRTLAGEAVTLAFGPWEWFWVLFYGLATYGNAGFLREQVCMYMCPYARFQSAMFDRDTLVVAYDAARGDPRGTRARSADRSALGLGDCIDCDLCVQVCPTGIDIRDGLQYECIGCAACIDACDGVMAKMHYPKGLIRYATENGLEHRLTRREMFARVSRPRVIVYSTILLAVCAAVISGLALRPPFKVDVVRDRASLGRWTDDGRLENVYRLQVMNVTESAQRYRVTVSGLEGARVEGSAEVLIDPAQAAWLPVEVEIATAQAAQLAPGVHALRFDIERQRSGPGEGVALVHEKSTFVVPR